VNRPRTLLDVAARWLSRVRRLALQVLTSGATRALGDRTRRRRRDVAASRFAAAYVRF
jgi:hypothetical protein